MPIFVLTPPRAWRRANDESNQHEISGRDRHERRVGGLALTLDLMHGTPADESKAPRHRRLAWPLAGALLTAGVLVATPLTRHSLSQTVTSLEVPQWQWLLLSVVVEAGSMAAFARTQRRLLHAAGNDRLAIGPFMAVTYAGNAISSSLPVAGPGLSSAFFFRQFRSRGLDDGTVAWTMIVSSLVSSLALALVLAVGAVAAGSVTGALLGLGESVLFLLPAGALLAALRFPAFRRRINRVLAVLVSRLRRTFGRPRPEVAAAFESSLEELVAIRVPPTKYLGVLGLCVWNWVADCLCLVAAILATGSVVPWRGILLAYGAGVTARSIGLTPGGIGVTEAALSGALVVAGLRARAALDAVLIYRLISFWLVVLSGWCVMAALTHRQHGFLRAQDKQPAIGAGTASESLSITRSGDVDHESFVHRDTGLLRED